MLTKWIEMKAREYIAATAHSIARPANTTDHSSSHISAERLRDSNAGVNCRGTREYSVDAALYRLASRDNRTQQECREYGET